MSREGKQIRKIDSGGYKRKKSRFLSGQSDQIKITRLFVKNRSSQFDEGYVGIEEDKEDPFVKGFLKKLEKR
ncbi:hypothetical protein RUM43_008876 [Polyplax serrata]|uniref:Uncharacterized protein n=1 Tax=Polyplax serrata TaxID=468196 RepID=A0AAN8PVL0_POLSC